MIGASIPFRHSIHYKYSEGDVVEFKLSAPWSINNRGTIIDLKYDPIKGPTYTIILNYVIVHGVLESEIIKKVGTYNYNIITLDGVNAAST